jgi:signal transduction histidine kinase
MNSVALHVIALSTIALMYLVIALAAWRARPDTKVSRLFALQAVLFSGWTLGNALVQTGLYMTFATMLSFATASLIPPALLTFTIHYPVSTGGLWTAGHKVALAAGLAFASASVGTEWLVYDVRFESGVLLRRAGPIYPLFIVYVVVVVAASLTVFVQKCRTARDRQRAQLHYYGLGLTISSCGAITSNLIVPVITGHSNFSYLGPYFGAPFIALTAHSIIRHRFMDLRIVLHRALTLGLAMAMFVLPLFAIFILISRPARARLSLTTVEMVAGGALCLSIAVLIAPCRDIAERFLDRYVYRVTNSPRHALRYASAKLAGSLNMERLTSVIVETINTAVQPEGLAVYYRQNRHLGLSARRIAHSDSCFTAPLHPPQRLVELLSKSQSVLVRDELEKWTDPRIAETLNSRNWALVLPLTTDQSLTGLVVLGPKLSGDPFFAEDVDALITIANHAATALKNAALYAEIALANQYLNNVVGAMQSGVIAVGRDGSLTLLNHAARSMLRLPSDPPPVLDVIPKELRLLLDTELPTSQDDAGREIMLTIPGQSEPLSIFCTMSPLQDHAGRRAGAMVVFSDLAPFKELDRERTRNERFATLQRLTQMVAHEIANPLVPIKTLAQLLPERLEDRAFALDLSRIVSRELGRIERLVDRLRRLAPATATQHDKVDLRIPIEHALELIQAEAASKSIDLKISTPIKPIEVTGDSAELEEVFLNLISDALDAIADASPAQRVISITVLQRTGRAIVQIGDTGPGIRNDLAPQIFDPFFTSKPYGSGLGLAICRGTVERHGGCLTYHAREGGGAVFTVELPLAIAEDLAKGVGIEPGSMNPL